MSSNSHIAVKKLANLSHSPPKATTILIVSTVLYGYLFQYPQVSSYAALYTLISIYLIIGTPAILSTAIDRNRSKFFLPLFVLILLLSFLSLNPYILMAFIIATAANLEKVTLKNIAFHYLWISSILFILTLTLFYFSLLPDNTFIRDVAQSDAIRSSLGFANPNTPFLFLFTILASMYYIYGGGRLFYTISVSSIIIVYLLTGSRSGLLMSSALILVSLLGLLRVRAHGLYYIFRILLPLGIPILLTVSIALAVMYGQSSYHEDGTTLNTLLSNRLWLWNNYIQNEMLLTAFGSSVENQWVIDNTYLKILIEDGLVMMITVSWVYYKGTRIMREDIKLLSVTSLFLLYGISENNISPSINFILPIMFLSILMDHKIPRKHQSKIENKPKNMNYNTPNKSSVDTVILTTQQAVI